MPQRHRVSSGFLAFIPLALTFLTAGAAAQEYPHNAVVGKDVRMELSIYGGFHGTIPLTGHGILEWSDPVPEGPMLVTNMRWMQFDLAGSIVGGPVPDVFVSLSPMPQSLGEATGLLPGEWCPAESFFDVFPMVMAEGLLPGVPLHTNEPVHLSGVVHGMPFQYDTLQTAAYETVTLYDPAGDPRGEIVLWRERVVPLAPPEAFVWVETSKGSNLARVFDGAIRVHAAMTGGLRPASASFGIRPAGSGGPFDIFWVDMDGSAPTFSTTGPMGSGDGWAGYLDVNIHVPVESFFDIFTEVSVPGIGPFFDTTTVFIDPTPPFPIDISIPPDSIGYFRRDAIFQVTCVVPEEDTSRVVMKVFPLATERHRALRNVDQFDVDLPDTNMNDMACGPTAAACCLDYWANNGHPEIDNPGSGSCSVGGMAPEDHARNLAGHMGTTAEDGTAKNDMAAGIRSYLARRGMSGWDVSVHDVDGPYGLAGMCGEFEADEEDVIMLVSSVDANGDTVGHAVTLGSKASMTWEQDVGHARVLGMSFRLDFMDPYGGGSTEENEYNVDWDDDGNPVLDGYDIGTGNPTRIEGYIKVSPPSGGGGYISLRRAPAQQEWITVCEITSTGDGLPDTLFWDTHGFAGGAYLLEIEVTDSDGRVGRDIRLCGIPEFVMGGDTPLAPRGGLDLRPPYPNPFNPGTTIEYSIAAPAKVTVTIHDATGRLVRTLVSNERAPAGRHRVAWDGDDDGGSPVASGAYFCRVAAGDRASSVKLILVR